ncbi:MAG: hypothetical protein OXI64_02185 [Defluviicoccus sp.]|nr:hypothetical protein [Defluviicoccus sp.]
MREWLHRHGGYWTFGLFLLALFGAMGGMGVWGLSAQDDRQNARVESVSAVAESGIRRVEEKVGSEVKRLDDRVDNVLQLLGQIDARFDRVDERLDRVDERLDRVDERFDRMDAKLDRMNAKLDRLIAGLAAPRAK